MLLEETSRSLPAWALHPATAVMLILMVRAALKTPHASGRLLIVIVWLRYVMQAYHELTYTSIGGFSANAIASIAVCLAGGAILFRRLPELGRLPILVMLMITIGLSGLMNNALGPTLETLLKWGYFGVVLLATIDCLRRDNDARILGLLLWAFAPALVYQALSVALHVSKATESDGSISYIGGFNHEAAFSIVLITCLSVTTLAPRLHPIARFGLLATCLLGVMIANYRTSLFAAGPIIVGFMIFGAAHGLRPGRRVIVSLVGLLVLMGATIGANAVLAERMGDVGAIAEQGGEIIKSPDEFTAEERKLLSGRVYLWNLYLQEYSAGSDRTLLLGYGADSWVEKFGLYAHNTLISYLYEYGFIGTLLLVMVWIGMIARACSVKDWTLRGQLVCTHIGFILLNMATMPFWMIEGLIFYGLLCGYTVAVTAKERAGEAGLLQRRFSPPRAQMQPGSAAARRHALQKPNTPSLAIQGQPISVKVET
jgi:hypothetical protein